MQKKRKISMYRCGTSRYRQVSWQPSVQARPTMEPSPFYPYLTLHRTSPLLLLMSACIVRYQGTVQSHWMVGYELAADIAALHHVRVCIETDSHTSRLCTIQVLLLEGYCGPLCLILSPLDCCLLRRSWPDWLHSPESNITARETDLEDTMHSGSGTFHWQQLSGHASAVCLQLDFCIWHKHIL